MITPAATSIAPHVHPYPLHRLPPPTPPRLYRSAQLRPPRLPGRRPPLRHPLACPPRSRRRTTRRPPRPRRPRQPTVAPARRPDRPRHLLRPARLRLPHLVRGRTHRPHV